MGLFRYGYAAVVELLLKRGADPNFKDDEGKTAADVIGTDLSEDSREIVNALLRGHAQKVKNNRQRRLSCPAIPRTAMITAVNTSNGAMGASLTTAASSSSAPSLEKSQTLLPLPSVMVPSVITTASSNGEDRSGESSQSVRHNSFSAAAHIRVRKQGRQDYIPRPVEHISRISIPEKTSMPATISVSVPQAQHAPRGYAILSLSTAMHVRSMTSQHVSHQIVDCRSPARRFRSGNVDGSKCIAFYQ